MDLVLFFYVQIHALHLIRVLSKRFKAMRLPVNKDEKETEAENTKLTIINVDVEKKESTQTVCFCICICD